MHHMMRTTCVQLLKQLLRDRQTGDAARGMLPEHEPVRRRVADRPRDLRVDGPLHELSADGPMRAVVLLHPCAQLFHGRPVKAFDATLRLRVTRFAVDQPTMGPHLMQVSDDLGHLLLQVHGLHLATARGSNAAELSGIVRLPEQIHVTCGVKRSHTRFVEPPHTCRMQGTPMTLKMLISANAIASLRLLVSASFM